MIKILTSEQIRTLDRYTIENEPVSSVDLMERASQKFTDWFTTEFNTAKKVGIICGTGNNGGDGLAIGRMLREWGYPVKIWIIKGAGQPSPDFSANLERLKEQSLFPVYVDEAPTTEMFADRDVLIDAIFGSGLSRPVEGVYADVIKCINKSEAIIVAVDMPSGLMADMPSTGPIVQANFTIAFQSPRLSFLLPENHQLTGEWHVLDIGLHKDGLRAQESRYYLLTRKSVKRYLRSRRLFDHKGTFGHALLVAGSYGKVGAAVLAAKAVLRTGAGLLTVFAPRCGYQVLQTAVPEAMVIPDSAEEVISGTPDFANYQAVGIGPGLGQRPETKKAVRKLLENARTPMVLDADALNILSEDRELLHLVPEGSILTPHPKEFERLAGQWKDSFARLDLQRKMAADLRSVVVVKGAYTAIATPDGTIYFNSTGNPGMATGGTGDVLTGILTGLLTQGYVAEVAAILGVYLHGLAADIGVLETGQESFIASDLISFLPKAFLSVKR